MLDTRTIKNFFAESVNVKGRITRTDHFLRKAFLVFLFILAGMITFGIIAFLSKMFNKPLMLGTSTIIDFFFMVFFFVCAYIFGVLWNVVSVLRLHDMNIDGRWCILNFVIFLPLLLFFFQIYIPKPGDFPVSYILPVVIFVLFNLFLQFMNGDEKENAYGPVAWTPQEPGASKYSLPVEIASDPRAKAAVKRNMEAAQKAAANNGARKVDKNYIKHNDRYKPKTAKRK